MQKDIEQSEQKCPYVDQCDFIQQNAAKIPELIQRTRENYCFKNMAGCARFSLYEALSPDKIPPLMLPGQHEWARQIVEESLGRSSLDNKRSSTR